MKTYISKKDINGNSIQGNVLAKDTKQSLIRGEDKLLVSLGLSDILIIDTKDALLVANKKFSQDIKKKNTIEEVSYIILPYKVVSDVKMITTKAWKPRSCLSARKYIKEHFTLKS